MEEKNNLKSVEIEFSKIVCDNATNGKAEVYKEKLKEGFDEPIYDFLEKIHLKEVINQETIEEMGKRLNECMKRQKEEMEKRQKGEHDNNTFEIDIENFLYNVN